MPLGPATIAPFARVAYASEARVGHVARTLKPYGWPAPGKGARRGLVREIHLASLAIGIMVEPIDAPAQVAYFLRLPRNIVTVRGPGDMPAIPGTEGEPSIDGIPLGATLGETLVNVIDALADPSPELRAAIEEDFEVELRLGEDGIAFVEFAGPGKVPLRCLFAPVPAEELPDDGPPPSAVQHNAILPGPLFVELGRIWADSKAEMTRSPAGPSPATESAAPAGGTALPDDCVTIAGRWEPAATPPRRSSNKTQRSVGLGKSQESRSQFSSGRHSREGLTSDGRPRSRSAGLPPA